MISINKQTHIYKKLFKTMQPYLWALSVGILGLICVKALEACTFKFLLPKLINESLVTNIVQPSEKILLLKVLLGSILWGLARFVNKYFVGYSTKAVAKDLRFKILNHMLLLPISFFKNNSIGNLIAKVNYDVEQITRALTDSVSDLLSSVIAIIFCLGVMFSFSWKLTLTALTIAPLIATFLKIINMKIRKYSERVQQSIGDVSHLAHEIVEARQVIRIYQAIEQETERTNNLLYYNFKQELKFILVSAVSEATMRVILGFTLVILLYLVMFKVIHINPGAFVGLCGAMLALVRPIKQLSEVNSVINKGLAAACGIFHLLGIPTEHQNNNLINKKIKFDNIIIKLENVNFSYEKHLVLENINLTFAVGKTTAIIGRSGSGKSTLISLLPKFYVASAGAIYLNGVNINNIELLTLRQQFAVVTQQIVLLNDTIANNIAYGIMNKSSREAVIKAATLANAMEFIEKLPLGLDTKVGDNGNTLSGGQRQRIAIARAILKNAPILILDEATSALDPHSEALIQSALANMGNKITKIIIAHRMSTIEKADQIIVLEAGRIVAVGTHQELLNNIYYNNVHKAIINETV